MAARVRRRCRPRPVSSSAMVIPAPEIRMVDNVASFSIQMWCYYTPVQRRSAAMPNTTTPEERFGSAPSSESDRPVTLINKFVVPVGRDDAFLERWTEASEYFRVQPGFVSLRLHRAVLPDAAYPVG